jgi:hypothetical protein
MSFIFTRYLYELEEVLIALTISLLNKNEEVLFWAFELYYSGFKQELVDIIWKIYYDFYATLNPSFEVYLLSKNTTHNFNDDVKNIANILNSFIIRPYNLDVFILRKIIKNFDIENDIEDLKQLLTLGYNIEIAFYILEIVEERKIDDILNTILDYFQEYSSTINNSINFNKSKIINLWHKVKKLYNPKIILLSYIYRYYCAIKNLKPGRNNYVVVTDEDVVLYETIDTKKDNIFAHKILYNAYLYNIDSSGYMNLFKLKRDKIDIKESYYYNWLYYASFSPLWKSRISMFNGVIDHENKKVVFEVDNDVDLQGFYSNYGYEPDEQSLSVQNKCLEIGQNKDNNWRNFYKKYKGNSAIDINNEYLNEMDKVAY